MMNYYPYNSRKSLYRSKPGAVASGESLTLRLLLHKDACVYNAFLCIRKDGEDLVEYELSPAEWLEDYRFYDKTLTFSEGVYRYYFRYTSRHGEFFVSKEKHGNGTVSASPGELFRQTVYSKNFETPEKFKGGIIYQIFPDRFYSSGTEKQGVPADRVLRSDWGGQPFFTQNETENTLGNDYFGGDLKGIEEKIPYLASLGVNIIYLNPIFEAHSNHRYNTADYFKVDPLLGTGKDFISLCDTAHKNGIYIILDGVFSHTGDDSIYFNKSGRYDSPGAYGNENSPYRNWYKFNDSEIGYSSWWGVPSLPETDETNPDYMEFICGENGVLKHWLSLGADGWRLDVADELPDGFLDLLRISVKEEKSDALILGEVWEDATDKISYGERRRYLLGNQLDSVMNYPFSNGIIEYIRHGDAAALCDTVCDICEHYPKPALDILMNHIGTHDTARILSVLGRDNDDYGDREHQASVHLTEREKDLAIKRLKAAAVLQYTLVGIPSLFYGDEAGLEGLLDPFCRECYPWGKENSDLLSFYKELGTTRRSLSPLKTGSFEPFIADDGVFAFLRKDGNSAVLTAVNASPEPREIILPDGYETVFGKKDNNGKQILNQYEYLIAKFKRQEE